MKRPKPRKSILAEMRQLSELSRSSRNGALKLASGAVDNFSITAMCFGAVLALGWMIDEESGKPSERILAHAMKKGRK